MNSSGVIDQNGQIPESQSLKSESKICLAKLKYASSFLERLSKQKLPPASKVWSGQKSLQPNISRHFQVPVAQVEKDDCGVGLQPHCFRNCLSKQGIFVFNNLLKKSDFSGFYLRRPCPPYIGLQGKHKNVARLKIKQRI